jgi:hypothetical protein
MGFELRASCFLGRCSTTWAMSSILFALAIFQKGSGVFTWTSLRDFPTSISCIAGIRDMHHCAQLLFHPY